MTRPLTTQDILGLKPYVPGKPVEELERELGIKGSVKLASNENPLGPSPKALEAAKKSLAGINRYPDGSGYYLKRALAERHGVPEQGIVLGNGSNEIIELIVRTFLLEGEKAVMAEPSFVVYRLASQAAGRERVVVPLKDHRHDLDAMAAEAARPGSAVKLVFIANPNNPTGTMNTAGELERLMDAVPDDVIVVMDEAYHEYVTDPAYPDSLGYIKDGRNLIALRTFSKAYGLAGLRIGYALAPVELALLIERVRQPFNTNSPAQAAALAALGDDEHVKESVRVNEEGKRYLYAELGRLGVKYLPTHANFVYIELGQGAREVYDRMLRQGVIVRPMGPSQIRVTVGLPDENARFISALKGAL